MKDAKGLSRRTLSEDSEVMFTEFAAYVGLSTVWLSENSRTIDTY